MKRRLATLPLLAALLGAALSAGAQEKEPEMRGITVQGTGEVQVRPDIARLTLGVQTQAAESSAAARENANRTTQVINAVKQAGVAEKDIQTANYSIQPQYDHRPRPLGQEAEPPRILGYQVSNTVRVVVRKIDDVGKIIDAAVGAGANLAGGIAFDLDDPTPAREEAMRKAVADALRKGKVIADAAGVRPIRLVAVTEGIVGIPRPLADAGFAMRAAEAVPTPVQPGEQTITATVTARFAIGSP